MKKLIMLAAIAMIQTTGAFAAAPAAPAPMTNCTTIFDGEFPGGKGIGCDLTLVLCQAELNDGRTAQTVYTDMKCCNGDGKCTYYSRTDHGFAK